jgi:ABC-type phosphate transport system substrate-binding protein
MCRKNGFIHSLAVLITLTAGASASAASVIAEKGSDTLYDVMNNAITAWSTDASKVAVPTDTITYAGTGSGTGEKAMALHSVTPYQSIAAMSRNLTAAAMKACEARPGMAGKCRPEIRNVLGLDAATVVENAGGGAVAPCSDLTIGLDAVLNDGTAPNGNQLQLILGGKDGKGTIPACTDPARVAAIEALRTCATGVTQMSHFYRRDDNSGTSDTMREKLKIDRFCNGESKPPSPGGINNDNPDNDPIRGTCPAANASRLAVKCTVTDPSVNSASTAVNVCTGKTSKLCKTNADCLNTTAPVARAEGTCGAANGTLRVGMDCSYSATTPGCTAGFVIPITDPDPTPAGYTGAAPVDQTLSIALRAQSDANGGTFGYGGRTAIYIAVDGTNTATGPSIDTITPDDVNVVPDIYLLSRRLWLHDTIVQGGVLTNESTGNTAVDAAEAKFFRWATDSAGSNTQSANTGRQNMDPIMTAWGFIPCTSDSTQPSGPGNLCSKTNYNGCSVTVDKACATAADCPTGETCKAMFPLGFGAPTKCTSNTITNGLPVATACTAGTVCCSDGHTCGAADTCPVPTARAAGFACKYNADCASAAGCNQSTKTCNP